MAKNIIVNSLLCSVILIIALNSCSAKYELCHDVMRTISPCLGFLMGGFSEPSKACCSGLGLLTRTNADRKELCECLKSAAQGFDFDAHKATSMSQMCKSGWPVPVSPVVNCAKV